MKRNQVAIPVAMMFVAISMMFSTLGTLDSLGALRVVFWVAGPMFAVIGLVLAYQNLRRIRRDVDTHAPAADDDSR
ncbi:hypothetical protein [Curtobacterium sp. MCPF17_031]|uniref:hypothetical protein n=1 Tax=Curtobacterium sp. MCPF17_031 TaxID=2175653 RepID=UPI000DA8E031|nr:hypothetical protein [Curtobacterium sp. MCPF17_031]PZE33916.1 hypothetical protein DEJ31_15865 [Curtobacterium sp. MCPF17_031]